MMRHNKAPEKKNKNKVAANSKDLPINPVLFVKKCMMGEFVVFLNVVNMDSF